MHTIDIKYVWPNFSKGGVVAAQLAERLLPTPEVSGSNPVIGKIEHLLSTVLKRRK